MFPRSTILALAIATLATPVLAAPVDDQAGQVTAEVKVTDLNLASPADQSILRHRIRQAASHVCGIVNGTPDTANTGFRECFRQSFADGWRQAETQIASAEARQQVASIAR